MPKIFSEHQKQLLYKMLKDNSINLIQKKGYKNLTIRDLTKISGISTGTFYHFYNSKEDLILAVIEEVQHNLENRFLKFFECDGIITKSKFIDLYYFFFMEDKTNILRYLSRDDITTILLRAKKKQSFETAKISIARNMKYLDKPKQTINFDAVINFIQLINLCLENSDLLVKDEMGNTIRRLLENIADEIFEGDINEIS